MRLLLVYNADSGLFNALTDTAHKLLSPQTYDCRLCLHTYGPLGMRRAWRDFLAGLGCEIAFFHRDEFRRSHGHHTTLPAILREEAGELEVLVPSEAIDACEDLEALQRLVETALAAREQEPPEPRPVWEPERPSRRRPKATDAPR